MRYYNYYTPKLGFFYFIIIIIMTTLLSTSESSSIPNGDIDSNNSTTSHRKLLTHRGKCTSKEISISQSKETSTGIPQYIVEITNTCVFGSSCSPSNIHLHCGWFASERMVNPLTFKRLSFDDCLVNAGEALRTSQVIRFAYSNSFMYPLSFKSAKFC